MQFKDKLVWITGASSGIGEALAYEFAKEGARLILSARRQEALETVKKNCTNSESHQIVALDLMQSSEFEQLAKDILGPHESLDLLINNAGVSQRSLLMETSLLVHRQIMEVNYFGTVALTQAILPYLRGGERSGVITISSLVGKFTTPLRSAYAASKHAITAYMDSLRAEVQSKSLQFTTIYPGFIKTNLTYKALLADGTEQNSMDDAQLNGMEPNVCARKIIKAYMKGKDEAYIGGKETYAVYLKRFFPKLFSKIIKKAKVT